MVDFRDLTHLEKIEASRRDDILEAITPSDIREMLGDIIRYEEALDKIANDEVTHTKLNQQRLCCKFQDIALTALLHVPKQTEGKDNE